MWYTSLFHLYQFITTLFNRSFYTLLSSYKFPDHRISQDCILMSKTSTSMDFINSFVAMIRSAILALRAAYSSGDITRLQKSAEAHNNNAQGCLLRLPAEIRCQIYDIALEDCKEPSRGYRSYDFRLPPPALLRVCKQIRSETTDMWYATTRFQLPAYTLRDFHAARSAHPQVISFPLHDHRAT